jgi:ABC-2 type transport system permease protein
VRHTVSVARAVAWRQLHNSFTNPAIIIPSLAFPLVFLIAFAGGLSAVSKVPGFGYPAGYTAFQYVFVFLQAAAFGGFFVGLGIAADFETGFARRLFLATPHRSGLLVGYAIGGLVRFLVTALIITVAALIAGMDLLGDPVQIIGLFTLAILLNIAATCWAAGVAYRMKTVQAGPVMQVPIFVLLFLAPVYVPQHLLAGWIDTAAQYNPATYLLNAGRGFVGAAPQDSGLAFGLVLAMVAVLGLWAMRSLRRAERGL